MPRSLQEKTLRSVVAAVMPAKGKRNCPFGCNQNIAKFEALPLILLLRSSNMQLRMVSNIAHNNAFNLRSLRSPATHQV
jgi:hypothetical protein